MRKDVYRRYLLIVLLAILAFNYVDRLALGLLLQDIKAELGLTDTQLGLMSGIAFALFYSVMGIPIARWADRGNRITIISVTTALWSIAVSLCGIAGSFLQLLVIRVGVAVGEAGCMPSAQSLIADVFTRQERPRALAIYMLGGSASMLIGYFLAGWLNQSFGWRVTFMLLGVPGMALATLAALSLRDPRASAPAAMDTSRQPSLREALCALWSNRSFRHLLFCFSIASFFGYGILQWQPAFFMRSYGLKTGALGGWFALIYGAAGVLGTYWGGALAARFAAGNERLQLRAMSLLYVAFAISSAFMYLSSSATAAFAWMALAAVGGAAVTGPMFATIQTLVAPEMRATAIAFVYLFANLVGMGLGPLAAGALSDALTPVFAGEALRYALLTLCPGYLWGAWHLWRASRTVLHDLERVSIVAVVT
jgi:predicted MFS family arabinose efflux permease